MDARKPRMPVGTIVKITKDNTNHGKLGKLGRIHADPEPIDANEPRVIFPV